LNFGKSIADFDTVLMSKFYPQLGGILMSLIARKLRKHELFSAVNISISFTKTLTVSYANGFPKFEDK